MTWFKRVLPPILLLAVAACNEAVGPAEDAQGPMPTHSLHHLQWATTMTADRFTATATTGAGDEVALAAGPSINAAFNGLGDGCGGAANIVPVRAVHRADEWVAGATRREFDRSG